MAKRRGVSAYKTRRGGNRAFTTGASQELYQVTGRTPGVIGGGASKRRRNTRRIAKARARAEELENKAEELENIAEEMKNRAEEIKNTVEHRPVATPRVYSFRANAPSYVPSSNLVLKLNKEAIKEYNKNFEREVNNILRSVHEFRPYELIHEQRYKRGHHTAANAK